jgi:hypothetical protein
MTLATVQPAQRPAANSLDLAVVVPSCDAYADLWPPFFANLFRRWPDCPFPIYLVANELEHPDPRVRSLKVGDDRGWSHNLKEALGRVTEKRVLLIIEDLFPTEQIHTESIVSLAEQIGEFDYLRLNPSPGPRRPLSARFGVVPPGDIYRTSTVFSIWRRTVLRDLLSHGETAWQFELGGSARSDRFERWFASRRRLVPYVNLVIKGRVDPVALEELRELGVAIETSREVLTSAERWTLELKKIRSRVLQLLPWRLQRVIRAQF